MTRSTPGDLRVADVAVNALDHEALCRVPLGEHILATKPSRGVVYRGVDGSSGALFRSGFVARSGK